ncbi:LANO_0F02476g1_1 [Lachancea nothofagi CBS 11611]|uniref:LANO_0F02476g1_1 n=1 Tax=Lachancea nothofagi CBS 11611 TaxID=1266666 RepID=A0A1G4K6X2_9SACH|nr:LANO_0F02476g1_1 [Lachancea nothofagi CBS 11611]
MESRRLHWKDDVCTTDGSRRSSSNRGTVTFEPKDLSSGDPGRDLKSATWPSSISTITEELPSPDVPEPVARVHSANSAMLTPYCSVSSESTQSQSKRNSDSSYIRSWNVLPRIGESLHSHKYSMNVAIHSVNGTPKQIVYDPRYNPLLPKLEVFCTFNSQSLPLDSYVHAKSRLESFVKFLEVYHSSRKYESAYFPFNVSVSPGSACSGYPSYTSGVSYQDIGEILQLWYLQALKFLLDKNSFLFSSEIVDYMARLGPKKNAAIKNELQSTKSAPSALEETISRADILLVRCSFEEELGWQLALDEPNWNIVDLFIDFSHLRKPSFSTAQDDLAGRSTTAADDDADLFSSSSTSSLSSSTSTTCTINPPDGKLAQDEKAAQQNGCGTVDMNSRPPLPSSMSSENGSIIVQDCVGRNLDELAVKIKTAQDIAESRRPSVSHTSSQEMVSDQKQKGKSKKDQPGMLAKGSSALGLSNFFKRKNSHTGVEKSDSCSTSRQSSPNEPNKINLNIQNRYLEDYYASTLANYRRIVPPAHSLFTQKTSSKGSEPREKPLKDENKSYRDDFLQVKLPLKDNSFPVVICPDVWFTVELKKWKGFLSEIYRCIRPGGYLETSTSNFATVNDCNDLEKTTKEFPTSAEMKSLKDAISMEAARAGIQVFPMRHLVQILKKVGFINIKHSVVSLKRGDLTNNMGLLFEFLAMHQFDFQLRTNFLNARTSPPGTNPASFPMRYVQEHMGKADENAGVLRFVLITAQKPDVSKT